MCVDPHLFLQVILKNGGPEKRSGRYWGWIWSHLVRNSLLAFTGRNR
jgi:hypothetical protein